MRKFNYRALPVVLCLVINIPSGEVKVDGVILLHCRRKEQGNDLECEIHGVTIKKPNKYEFKVACPHQNAYDRVKVIVFDKSRAQFLPKSFFNVLRYVQSATLHDVGLENIHPSAFHYARDLIYLDLSQNLLQTIQTKEFNGANNLKILDLSYNQISNIDPEAFIGLDSLQRLVLVGNKIQNVDESFTAPIPRLEHLDLSYNSITDASAALFCTNETLLSLNLSANALNQLPNCIGSSISELVLSDNQISEINANQIKRINNLRSLDLSQNMIRSANLADGHELRLLSLNLSHCLVDRLGSNDFSRLLALQVLDISYNRLSHLPSDVFDPMKHLRELYIDGNLLRQIDLEAIKLQLRALELFSVSDNLWSCEYLDHILEVFCHANVKIFYSRGRACIDKNGNDVIIPVDRVPAYDDRRVAASDQLWFYVLLMFGIILSGGLGWTLLKKYCLNQFKYY